MIRNFTKLRIAKHFWLFIVILLILSFCIVNISFADEEFPWEIFYPAIIKKTIDNDKDGFTKEQGDCNDSDPSINPDATEICGDDIDQDCDGSDLLCFTCEDVAGYWVGKYSENYCTGGGPSNADHTATFNNDCSVSVYVYLLDRSLMGTFSLSDHTIIITLPDADATCGTYILTGTVNGNRISGTISSTGGSSGTFYFDKSN